MESVSKRKGEILHLIYNLMVILENRNIISRMQQQGWI